MRAVIQRVSKARVTVETKVIAETGKGLLVLVGIEESDNESDVAWLAAKISNMRIFNDNEGVMNLSVTDIGGEMLVVSQFTLHASTRKGNRPSYIRAARPEFAIPMYNSFLSALEKETGRTVQSGQFGAMMQVELVNDGPVTITVDTKNKE